MGSHLCDQVGCLEVSAFMKVVQVFIPTFRRQTRLHETEYVCFCLSKREEEGGRSEGIEFDTCWQHEQVCVMTLCARLD